MIGQGDLTTRANVVDVVRPADITVTVGMKLPVIADSLAAKVRVPEGFVSVDAYFTRVPAGKSETETRAVSLGEPIWIGIVTGAAPWVRLTVEIGRYTEIGFCERLPFPAHPQEASAQIDVSRSVLAEAR